MAIKIKKANRGKLNATKALSREDYLRQQHQDYLKSQAEKGRKAVVEGREKFAKDYVIPAIKTVGSFTPAGPLIGLADAYESYQQGNTGWALAGAGMEALPYVGKGVGKGIKALSKLDIPQIKSNIHKINPWSFKPDVDAYYRAIGEEGYEDAIKEGVIRAKSNPTPFIVKNLNLTKSFSTPYFAPGKQFSALESYNPSYIAEVKNRSFKKGPGGNWGSTPIKLNEDGSFKRLSSVDLDDNVKLYKQDWWKGYKEVPKKEQGGTIPKAQEGISINKKTLYNQKRAEELNYTPDSIGHMPSRDYKTGLILKHPAHPTFKKGIEEDRKLGYVPMMDIYNNVYTVSPNDIPTEGYFSPSKKVKYQGGTITLANGGKAKKAVVFAEAPELIRAKYGYINEDLTPEQLATLPKELSELRELWIKAWTEDKDRPTYEDLQRVSANFYGKFAHQYPGVEHNELMATNSEYAKAYEEFDKIASYDPSKTIFKKDTRLAKYGSFEALERAYNNRNINPNLSRQDSAFIKEGTNLKNWYSKNGVDAEVLPIYGYKDTTKINKALSTLGADGEVALFGHSSNTQMGGIPNEWWNNKLTNKAKCLLGTCYGNEVATTLPKVSNLYHNTNNRPWYGVNPSGTTIEDAMFSRRQDHIISPKINDDYAIKKHPQGISTTFKDGGNFSPNMIGEVTVTGKRKKPTIPFVPSTIPAIDTNPGIKIPMAYPESDITVSREHIDRVNEGRDPRFRSLVPEQIDRYNMYDPHIKRAAYETGVDPKLIKNIMLVETGMKPRTNSLGYSGFAQTNQASIDTVNSAMGTNFTVDQMNDPYQAAKYIANYLKHTSNKHGANKVDELLVGYNWGPARINRYRKGAKLPAETEDYIKKFKDLLPVDETFNPNTDNTMSLGGILSAANMALDLYNQAEAKANARTADSFKNNMEARQKFVNDAEYLKGYNQSGSSRVEFYRNGGMHNLNARTMGNIGKFKKVGPNIFKVKGPKHSEGGVRMGNAEVEGGETVKITPNEIKVLSDNKKLFGYSPSVKLADRVSFGDPRIDKEFERQFRIQESIKKFRGVDNADMKAKDGNTFKLWDTVPKILKDFSWSKLFDGSGKTKSTSFMPETATDDPLKLEDWMTSTTSGHWMDKEPSTPVTGMPMVGDPNAKLNTKSSLGDMAPMLIDNIGNLIMDLNRPKIPTPVMMPPVKFKTDIDVNPQINAITSANRGAVSDINRNISDANVATALRMKLANQEGMSKQQILAGETNTETDLFNKQASANLYPNMINTSKINEYAEDTVNRKLGIQASLSQNLGNLARDFTHAIDTKNLRNLDRNRLKAELFKDTDAQLDRAIMFSDIFDDIIATDYQELLNNANLDPRIAKALAYRYNKMQKQ